MKEGLTPFWALPFQLLNMLEQFNYKHSMGGWLVELASNFVCFVLVVYFVLFLFLLQVGKTKC